MTTIKHILALGVCTITLATGCGGAEPGQPVKVADVDCATKPAPTTSQTPTVAVLAQLGRASSPIAAARQQALKLVVAGSAGLKAHFMLDGVGADIAAANLLVNTTLVAEGANTLFRDSNMKCKRDAINTEYTSIDKGTVAPKLDVFAALRTLTRNLEGVPHGVVHVVLLSSMLNTEGIDLTKSATLSAPARSINQLANEGQNFKCPGWRVYAIGGSFSTGDSASAAKDIALRQWWSAYFKHCGGVLVTYNTELAKFPLDARPVQGADLSTIEVERKPNVVVATLNSKVLFSVGRADLRPGADARLGQLVPLIAEARGVVEVDGYTDNTGTDAINMPLSRARARTVARWIATAARLDSVRLAIGGHGARQPIASNATAAGRARNRRVVVTIHR